MFDYRNLDDGGYADVDVLFCGETDAAILVEIEDGERVWIPKSQAEGHEDMDVGDEGTIEVALWFAEKEGLV